MSICQWHLPPRAQHKGLEQIFMKRNYWKIGRSVVQGRKPKVLESSGHLAVWRTKVCGTLHPSRVGQDQYESPAHWLYLLWDMVAHDSEPQREHCLQTTIRVVTSWRPSSTHLAAFTVLPKREEKPPYAHSEVQGKRWRLKASNEHAVEGWWG